MIQRIWHGWTAPENAEAFEGLLHNEIFPQIRAREIAGLRGLQAWRRKEGVEDEDGDEEVEFVTVLTFDDPAAVAEYSGGDPGRSVVPEAARKLLARFDEHSVLYEFDEAVPSGADGTEPDVTVPAD